MAQDVLPLNSDSKRPTDRTGSDGPSTSISPSGSTGVGRHRLLLLLAAGLLFFTNLGGPGLWDEDEPKNASCAQEMFARGDWVVPTFNHELRTDKPILIYWLLLSVFHLFGISEWTARLPSACLSVGTILMTYEIGRRLYRPQVGLWSALILAGSLMFDVAARACTPDGTLIFCTTLSLCLFVRFARVWSALPADQLLSSEISSTANNSSAPNAVWQGCAIRWFEWPAIYAAMSFAVLAKGPTGVLLPVAVIGLFHLAQRAALTDPWQPAPGWGIVRSRLFFWLQAASPLRIVREGWRMQPLWMVLTLVLIALPWYWLVAVRTDGAWVTGFLSRHNVDRFMQPLEGHSGPIFYYLIAITLGMLPWSLLFPTAIAQAFRRMTTQPASASSDRFLACWIGLYLAVFSLAQTKLPSYVLPCYPALAILLGRGWTEALQSNLATSQNRLALIFRLTAITGGLFAIGLPIAAFIVLPGGDLLSGLIGLFLVTGGLLAQRSLQQQQPHKAAAVFVVSTLLFGTGLFGFVAERIDQHQNSRRLVQVMQQRSGSRYQVGTYDFFRPSLVYYSARQVPEFPSPEAVREFLQASPDNYLISRDDQWASLQAVLPSDVGILQQERIFLRRRHDVLLIGRKTDSPLASPMKTAAETAAGEPTATRR